MSAPLNMMTSRRDTMTGCIFLPKCFDVLPRNEAKGMSIVRGAGYERAGYENY